MLSHISFATIPVTDPDLAISFYTDRFGMALTVDAPYGDTQWIILGIPGARTQLRLEAVARMPDRGAPTLPIIAPDVAATIGNLREAGVEIVSDPKPAEWNIDVTYALVRDSEGNVILLASG